MNYKITRRREFYFATEKNALLKDERGVNFDDAIYCIENGHILDVIENEIKGYEHQSVYIIELNGYAYMVPFVRNEEGVFFKTMYASRKMTKRYLGRNGL